MVFFSVFYTYENQLKLEYSTLKRMEENKMNIDDFSIGIDSYSYSSGRLKFVFSNKGMKNLKFADDKSVYCFEMFDNDKIKSLSDLSFVPFNYSLAGNYNMITPKELMSVSVFYPDFEHTNKTLKFISCYGNKFSYMIDSSKHNWLLPEFLQRSTFVVENSKSSYSFNETYYYNITEEDFDFTKNITDLVLVYPLLDSLVLDLTLDEYRQDLIDYTGKSNVYLGNGINNEISDPVSESGVLFGGLLFDGINDKVTVMSENLKIKKDFSFSLWIKPKSDTLSSCIFSDDTGKNMLSLQKQNASDYNLKMDMEFFSSSYSFEISKFLKYDKWSMITVVRNDDKLKFYIDGKYLEELSISNDEINTTQLVKNIAGLNNSEFYKGIMDEIKLYNVALNEDEIKMLFSNQEVFREMPYKIEGYSYENKTALISFNVLFLDPYGSVSYSMYYG